MGTKIQQLKQRVEKYKRNLQVRYYRKADTMPDYPDRWGYPASEEGILRGAMIHLIRGKYALARVYDTKTMMMAFSLHPRPGQFPEVRYGKHLLGVVDPRVPGGIRYGTR